MVEYIKFLTVVSIAIAMKQIESNFSLYGESPIFEESLSKQKEIYLYQKRILQQFNNGKEISPEELIETMWPNISKVIINNEGQSLWNITLYDLIGQLDLLKDPEILKAYKQLYIIQEEIEEIREYSSIKNVPLYFLMMSLYNQSQSKIYSDIYQEIIENSWYDPNRENHFAFWLNLPIRNFDLHFYHQKVILDSRTNYYCDDNGSDPIENFFRTAKDEENYSQEERIWNLNLASEIILTKNFSILDNVRTRENEIHFTLAHLPSVIFEKYYGDLEEKVEVLRNNLFRSEQIERQIVNTKYFVPERDRNIKAYIKAIAEKSPYKSKNRNIKKLESTLFY